MHVHNGMSLLTAGIFWQNSLGVSRGTASHIKMFFYQIATTDDNNAKQNLQCQDI